MAHLNKAGVICKSEGTWFEMKLPFCGALLLKAFDHYRFKMSAFALSKLELQAPTARNLIIGIVYVYVTFSQKDITEKQATYKESEVSYLRNKFSFIPSAIGKNCFSLYKL